MGGRFDELWDDYLQYLILIGGLKREKRFRSIFKILHGIEFRWVLERDENREDDGRRLRNRYRIPGKFASEEKEFFDRGASVFEVLLALSIRVNNETIGDPGDEHPEELFMEMIKNLNLDRVFDDGEVIDIVDAWMRRDFMDNGVGSPFPVSRDTRNQRYLEIWDQLNSYISENRWLINF